MYSINLYSKNPVFKIDLFDFKGGRNGRNVVEDGSYERVKDLFDNMIDLTINQTDKNEGFQTSEGLENIELGYDVAKVGYSGIKAAEAAYVAGAGVGGLTILGLISAFALAGGVAAIGVTIAYFAKEMNDRLSRESNYIITNPFDFQPTHLSGKDIESNNSVFQSDRDDWFRDFQDRLADYARDFSSNSSNGNSDRAGDHGNNSQDNSNTTENPENDNNLGKMSRTSMNDKVNLLGR